MDGRDLVLFCVVVFSKSFQKLFLGMICGCFRK